MRQYLTLALALPCLLTSPAALSRPEFERSVSLQGISFSVVADMKRPENTVWIKSKGLKVGNPAIKKVIFGSVTQVEVADLDADGSPEIYVFYTGEGSGAYGGLLGFAVNARKSMSEIILPDLAEDTEAGRGYMGHDEFSIVENRLGRRFPVYRSGDSNSKPTGGTRVLYYTLVKGEAGWILKLDESLNLAPAEK